MFLQGCARKDFNAYEKKKLKFLPSFLKKNCLYNEIVRIS